MSSRDRARYRARRFAERQGTKTQISHEKMFGNDAGDVGESGRVANDSRCGHASRRRATRSFVFVEKLRRRFCRMHTSRATRAPSCRRSFWTGARVGGAQQIPPFVFLLNTIHTSPPLSPSWRRQPAPPWRRRGLPAPSWTPPRRRSWFSQTLRCRTSGACRRRRAWRARRARC